MAGSRKALLIATDSYSDPEFSRLHAPAADAAGLYAVLSDPAIGDYAATQLVNVAEPGVTRAVEDFFADASRDDELLLYVSGHGVKDEDGQLYLATADSRYDRLGSTSVSARFLHDQMRRSRCRRIVVLLDCCYSGAFPSGLRHRATDRVDVLSQLGGRGYAVMTSSSALGYSYETVGPSVFTGTVINGLRTGEADLGGDGLIDIDELYDYAYDRVSAAVPGQTPQKKFDLGGTLYIAKSVRDRRPQPAIPPWPSPPASRAAPGAASPLPGQYTAADGDAETQPRTSTPGPPGTPVTVRNGRLEMTFRAVNRTPWVPALLLGAAGVITKDWGWGPRLFDTEPFEVGAEFVLAALAGALLGLIAGIFKGALIPSDALTLDSAMLTVTRRFMHIGRLRQLRRQDVYFWILWSVIERITVEDSLRGAVLRVWFRDGHRPTSGWLRGNEVQARTDGSFDVYRGSNMFSFPSTVDVRRLRALLPRYARHLYDDPSYAPRP